MIRLQAAVSHTCPLTRPGKERQHGHMPDRSRKRPTDLNRLAASIVQDATTDEPTPDPDDEKDPAAVALGRRGGLKGGRARAARLTPEERSRIARLAAEARWRSKGGKT